MKNMRKFFAMALAVVMVLSLATTAFAVDITIDDGDVKDAEYSAYKLLNATDGGEGKFAYTVNEKYRTALKNVLGANLTDDEIIAAIAAMKAEAIRTFADDIYEEVKGMKADYTTTSNVFTGVDQGYYLIVETKTGSVSDKFEEDTYSLVMLDTAGKDDITVETKEELPQSEKKVKDKNDSTDEESGWQDSADHDIGDAVPFQITFTLPSDFANYEKYYVGIHDVQAKGLTYNEKSLVVTVNGTDITTWFTYSAASDGCTFHISCEDIIAAAKASGVTLKAGDKIVFEYTSTLNKDAVLGSTGNPNEMYIEFSNNPYGDGKSRTPNDKVIVFTYKVNVDKFAEKVEDGAALTGANFTLYKEVPADTEGALTGVAIKEAFADNVKADKLDDAKSYIVVGNKTGDATGSTFGFKGVDDGNYVLVETTIPDGYNAWDAVAFTISATHVVESDDPTLTTLTGGDLVTGEFKDTGIIDADIINKSGTGLPSTGGMGTTLFYIFGAILMVGAAVLLITKRRMSMAE